LAIDLDALRAKHAELNTEKKGGDNADFLAKFLSLNIGTNVIRILPGKDDDTLFYAETSIHRVPNGQMNDNGSPQTKNMHCRKIHGEACPICDSYYALWKPPYLDEDLARQVKPRSRYYMNVVDRETREVKILSCGVIIFKKIIAAMLDEDYGDITDLKLGHDYKIHKEMDGKWPKYDQSQPRPKSEPAGTKADVAAWMDQLHDIHGLVKLEDYDVFKAAAETLTPSQIGNTSQGTPEDVDDDEYLSKMQS
tara:strand:+ start:22627 stop:23379 length:753 start_codon:yes stop_codon:yes gene_type:complete